MNEPIPRRVLDAMAEKNPTNKDPTLKSRIVLKHLRKGSTENNLEWGRWLLTPRTGYVFRRY